MQGLAALLICAGIGAIVSAVPYVLRAWSVGDASGLALLLFLVGLGLTGQGAHILQQARTQVMLRLIWRRLDVLPPSSLGPAAPSVAAPFADERRKARDLLDANDAADAGYAPSPARPRPRTREFSVWLQQLEQQKRKR